MVGHSCQIGQEGKNRVSVMIHDILIITILFSNNPHLKIPVFLCISRINLYIYIYIYMYYIIQE